MKNQKLDKGPIRTHICVPGWCGACWWDGLKMFLGNSVIEPLRYVIIYYGSAQARFARTRTG